MQEDHEYIKLTTTPMVVCPICSRPVKEIHINSHIDSGCTTHVEDFVSPPQTQSPAERPHNGAGKAFFTSSAKKVLPSREESTSSQRAQTSQALPETSLSDAGASLVEDGGQAESAKRPFTEVEGPSTTRKKNELSSKRSKNAHAPLAERMRPKSLDEVAGQDLVGPNGILRSLIQTDRVPSMILWGGPGTGKTTIARLIAQTAGTRFVEINSTSSGVAECKKIFTEASNELGLTGRRTIIFCDEIHRFSKSQQDVFLGPVEAGTVTLIGATTENPSFKVANALLSRCRTFTLAKLTEEHVFQLLKRGLENELETEFPEKVADEPLDLYPGTSYNILFESGYSLLHYLAAFADGDARTGLNLLQIALDLCRKPGMTSEEIKSNLTKTLVYDRAGDQHYDTISAFHKSVRGSDADAALYYLARMLQSGEDPLYIARRMVVIASEDVGLADNSMLPLCIAAYTAAEKIGMPECRINLAHCTVALCQAPKSVRAYRALGAAYAALKEPGVAGLPVPIHLRNAPTRLMKELDYGREYKYNPDYVNGKVKQDYLPDAIRDKRFLCNNDLGDKVDSDLAESSNVIESEAQSETASTVPDEHMTSSFYYDDNGDLLLNPDGD